MLRWCAASPWGGLRGSSDDGPCRVGVQSLADSCGNYCLGRLRQARPVRRPSLEEVHDMSVGAVIAVCLVAFGLGYAGGSVIRIARKAIECID